MPQVIPSIRNGAVLATLAATPILIGLIFELLWGQSNTISTGTSTALVLAWAAGTAVVAIRSHSAAQDGETTAWFYPCSRCGRRVALISYRCIYCKTKFTPPPAAADFRNTLLMGVAVFYAAFTLGAYLLNR
jgi:hypothetical protein